MIHLPNIARPGLDTALTRPGAGAGDPDNGAGNGFDELIRQSLRDAGGLPTGLQVGLGLRAAASTPGPGSPQQTAGRLTVAIRGEGFFQVRMPDGSAGYTRDGALRVGANGALVSGTGQPVQPAITVPANARSVAIATDGTVSATLPGQSAPQVLGRLQLASFINPAGLQARSGNVFSPTLASGAPQTPAPNIGGLGELQQGLMDAGSLDLAGDRFADPLAGRPDGLSEAIMKQLERQMGLSPGPIPATGSANNTPAPLSATPQAERLPQTGALGFVQQHTASARKAEAATGIPASFMVSQAALETGWGRKEIRHADGSPSFNLFGIKAGGNWKGPVAEVTTTEYIDGKPRKVTAQFRAYGSYAESFGDYASLMKQSPRYQAALSGAKGATAAAAGGSTVASTEHRANAFAQGLQRGGYATDPAYADKLTRVINTTLRLQRSLT